MDVDSGLGGTACEYVDVEGREDANVSTWSRIDGSNPTCPVCTSWIEPGSVVPKLPANEASLLAVLTALDDETVSMAACRRALPSLHVPRSSGGRVCLAS